MGCRGVLQHWNEGNQRGDGVLESLGVEVRRRRALDFGCGAGRLSQALCEYFDSCDGVDVAPSMIDLARRFNRQGERCRCPPESAADAPVVRKPHVRLYLLQYRVAAHDPRCSLAYVRDFLRVLDVDGLAVFRFQVSCWSRLIHKGAPTALPDEAFRAKLRLLDVPPRIAAASRHRLKVSVRNVSEHVWPALGEGGDQCPVRLGNRWRTRSPEPS